MSVFHVGLLLKVHTHGYLAVGHSVFVTNLDSDFM